MKLLHSFFKKIKRFYYLKILKRKYYRTGSCNCCGKCCEKIYVKHGKNLITDEEVFKKLQKMHRFYEELEVVDKDETGLVFKCNNLDPKTRMCRDHKNRAKICRDYPQEEIFMMGAQLCDECGYEFTPIVPFDEVFSKILKSKKKDENSKHFTEEDCQN